MLIQCSRFFNYPALEGWFVFFQANCYSDKLTDQSNSQLDCLGDHPFEEPRKELSKWSRFGLILDRIKRRIQWDHWPLNISRTTFKWWWWWWRSKKDHAAFGRGSYWHRDGRWIGIYGRGCGDDNQAKKRTNGTRNGLWIWGVAYLIW